MGPWTAASTSARSSTCARTAVTLAPSAFASTVSHALPRFSGPLAQQRNGGALTGVCRRHHQPDPPRAAGNERVLAGKPLCHASPGVPIAPRAGLSLDAPSHRPSQPPSRIRRHVPGGPEEPIAGAGPLPVTELLQEFPGPRRCMMPRTNMGAGWVSGPSIEFIAASTSPLPLPVHSTIRTACERSGRTGSPPTRNGMCLTSAGLRRCLQNPIPASGRRRGFCNSAYLSLSHPRDYSGRFECGPMPRVSVPCAAPGQACGVAIVDRGM